MPRILLSNDDGIHSPGLHKLAEALEALGEVTVVAPDRERSAASHAISLHHPLRIQTHGERRYAVDGTPTDSVYVGIHHVMRETPPDLCISGINLGANLANDVIYSGTVAAAFEACLFGVPAVAMSLAAQPPWDFAPAAAFAARLAEALLRHGLPRGTLLNVNVPAGEPEGYRVAPLGRRRYGEHVDVRHDPWGRSYYWIGGGRQDHDDIPGSDCNTVFDERLISVTPLHLDLTHTPQLAEVRGWDVRGYRRWD